MEIIAFPSSIKLVHLLWIQGQWCVNRFRLTKPHIPPFRLFSVFLLSFSYCFVVVVLLVCLFVLFLFLKRISDFLTAKSNRKVIIREKHFSLHGMFLFHLFWGLFLTKSCIKLPLHLTRFAQRFSFAKLCADLANNSRNRISGHWSNSQHSCKGIQTTMHCWGCPFVPDTKNQFWVSAFLQNYERVTCPNFAKPICKGKNIAVASRLSFFYKSFFPVLVFTKTNRNHIQVASTTSHLISVSTRGYQRLKSFKVGVPSWKCPCQQEDNSSVKMVNWQYQFELTPPHFHEWRSGQGCGSQVILILKKHTRHKIWPEALHTGYTSAHSGPFCEGDRLGPKSEIGDWENWMPPQFARGPQPHPIFSDFSSVVERFQFVFGKLVAFQALSCWHGWEF